ncbi:flippase [Malikia spinosa]|uniref:Flippase n=1 Tax=Malikia spinosa TaxID=86180 RepID=A0A2S9KDC9_9BURK|nr:lipopolysaccharide biosynthesis protein [Malikia spinosa]PRD68385.1 flippase [Malikia spinosa]
MSLTKKTTLGIFWNFTDQLLRRGITLATTLLLAYILSPESYGLISIIAVFTAIATGLMDSGFRQAIIRLKTVTDVDLDTAFYANLILGVIAYLLLYLSAPHISNYYQEPKLTILIKIMGLTVLIDAFQVVQQSILHRQLNFKNQLKASFPAALGSSLISIGLAILGAGVWSLVFQMLTSSLITVLILWRISEWRPGRNFTYASLCNMYSFGYKLFLSGILDTIFKNLYIIIIAKFFTTSVAGLYFFAEKIRELILSQLVGAIQNVTYPALSKIQDDNEKLKSGYRKIIAITTFVLFPTLSLLAALAQPLFEILLPSKWLPAVPYLQLLCFSGFLYPLHSINLNILKVKGRSDLFLQLEIIKKILIAAMIYFTYKHNIEIILIGQILTSIISYIPNSYFSSKLINYSIKEQIADFVPALALSLSIGILVHYSATTIRLPPTLQLILLGGLGAAMYVISAYFLRLQACILAFSIIKAKLFHKSK